MAKDILNRKDISPKKGITDDDAKAFLLWADKNEYLCKGWFSTTQDDQAIFVLADNAQKFLADIQQWLNDKRR